MKRIISSENWFNYVVLFFFFFENVKNLGRSDDAKRRKKGPVPCAFFPVDRCQEGGVGDAF